MRFALLTLLTAWSRSAAAGGWPVGKTGPECHDRPGRLGNCTRLRQIGCRYRFGAIYAQAEDDFNRVETNYLTSLGRTAEAEGESKMMQDLRQKLFIDPVELKKLYGQSPLGCGSDDRLGRRPEFLPGEASRSEAAHHHALRTVDGAELHGGQYRRRHREGGSESTGGVLRRRAGEPAEMRTRASPRASRFQRDRHRAFQHKNHHACC